MFRLTLRTWLSMFSILLIATGISTVQAASLPDSVLQHMDPELRETANAYVKHSGDVEWTDKNLPLLRKQLEQLVASEKEKMKIPTDVSVETLKIPVGQQHPDVTVYVVNAKQGENRPGILHTHGGGTVVGKAEFFLPILIKMAKENNWVIVSVDYRLAPETNYKGSTADNYAGLRWMHDNAKKIGLNQQKIAVMGESAGGLFATLLAIEAREKGDIPLAAQILIYPMLDDRTGTTVHLPDFIGAAVWTPQANNYGWRGFLGTEPGGANVPTAAVPARVNNLSGLPRTFIGVGSVDLFVKEDIDYAGRLIEAGVPTELLVVPGAFHGFDLLAPDSTIGKRFNAAVVDALRRAFE